MQSLFTSDLHLGHRAIVKYRTFKTAKEHDDYIIDKILELPKRSVLTILGDFMFDGPHFDSYVERLYKKKCKIKLVMGNHDSKLLYLDKYQSIFEVQLPFYSYKNMWVSHCPIHPDEFRKRVLNIHGHLHQQIVPDERYFNVNLDVNNYEFVKLEQIKEQYEKVNARNAVNAASEEN